MFSLICIRREGTQIRNTQCRFIMQSTIRLCTRGILSFVGTYIHDTCRDESSPPCRMVSDTSRLRCGPPSAVWYSLVCMSLWLSTCPLYFLPSLFCNFIWCVNFLSVFCLPEASLKASWLTDWLQLFVFWQSCIRITGRALSCACAWRRGTRSTCPAYGSTIFHSPRQETGRCLKVTMQFF